MLGLTSISRYSDRGAMLKAFKRCNPVEFAIYAGHLQKRRAAVPITAVDVLKQRFEVIYGSVLELKKEDRWVFIALCFKLIYPEAYREDIKDFNFTDGFSVKACSLLNMHASNFSEEFKAVRVNLTTKDSELRKAVDRLYEELGYAVRCQQTTLFGLVEDQHKAVNQKGA